MSMGGLAPHGHHCSWGLAPMSALFNILLALFQRCIHCRFPEYATPILCQGVARIATCVLACGTDCHLRTRARAETAWRLSTRGRTVRSPTKLYARVARHRLVFGRGGWQGTALVFWTRQLRAEYLRERPAETYQRNNVKCPIARGFTSSSYAAIFIGPWSVLHDPLCDSPIRNCCRSA